MVETTTTENSTILTKVKTWLSGSTTLPVVNKTVKNSLIVCATAGVAGLVAMTHFAFKKAE